jgi:hypothetical protein
MNLPRRLAHSLVVIGACCALMAGPAQACSRLYDMSLFLSLDAAGATTR